MSTFCKKHSVEMFGEDLDDVKADPGGSYSFLCEGCGGWITVDEHGEQIKNVVDFKTGNWLEENEDGSKKTDA